MIGERFPDGSLFGEPERALLLSLPQPSVEDTRFHGEVIGEGESDTQGRHATAGEVIAHDILRDPESTAKRPDAVAHRGGGKQQAQARLVNRVVLAVAVGNVRAGRGGRKGARIPRAKYSGFRHGVRTWRGTESGVALGRNRPGLPR